MQIAVTSEHVAGFGVSLVSSKGRWWKTKDVTGVKSKTDAYNVGRPNLLHIGLCSRSDHIISVLKAVSCPAYIYQQSMPATDRGLGFRAEWHTAPV